MIAGEFASWIVDGESKIPPRLPDESARSGVLPTRPFDVGDVASYGTDRALILSILLTTAPCPLGSVPRTIRSPGTAQSRSSRVPLSDVDLLLDDPGPHLIIAFICPAPAVLSLELVSCVVSKPVSIDAEVEVLLIVHVVTSVSLPFILSHSLTKPPAF